MKRILALVNVTGLVVGISYGLHGPVLPLFAKNVVGAGYTELGLIGMMSFLPYMFIPLLVGMLLDRFNNGHLLAAGSAMNAISIYLLSMAQSVPEIIGLRVVTGIAHSFFWPPCESIISNHSSDKDRVRNISQFTMFFVGGFMAGPLMGTALLEQAGATYVTLFQATGLILATTLVSALLASQRGAPGSRKRFSAAAIWEMRRFPEVVIIVVFFAASFGVMLAIYPAFLGDAGMSDTVVLLLYFVFGVSRMASLGLASRLARRTSTTLVLAAASISAGMAMSAASGSAAVFAVALALMGFGMSIFFPLTLEVVLSRTHKAMSGKMIGAYETVVGTGFVAGPALAGTAAQSLGDKAPYIGLCVAGIGITVLAAMSRRKLEPARRP